MRGHPRPQTCSGLSAAGRPKQDAAEQKVWGEGAPAAALQESPSLPRGASQQLGSQDSVGGLGGLKATSAPEASPCSGTLLA